MFDLKKLDNYFNADSQQPAANSRSVLNQHSRFVKLAKLALPSAAAILLALLLLFPYFKTNPRDFRLDITRPKQGELEKLHIENTVFYITDKDNRVNNFVASNIDETEPGSKLIKLTNPEGILPTATDRWVSIKAPYGYFNQNTNLLELNDNVELFYSEGMTINTASAFFDFNSARGYGNKPVSGQGFFGTLQAEGFEYSSKNDILTFTGHNNINIKEESFAK